MKKNEVVETIDGYAGVWRTVTKPSELTLGQRVRYDKNEGRFGYFDNPEEEDRIRFIGEDEFYGADAESIFKDFDGTVEAFFTIRTQQDGSTSVDATEKEELVNSLQETMRTLAFVTFLSLKDHPDMETAGSIEAVLNRARSLISKHKSKGNTL